MGWITCIGDLHGRTPQVREDSYLVLLAGDICADLSGPAAQARWLDTDFRSWLASLPCPCVAVPGNHDIAIFKKQHTLDLPWTLLDSCRTVDVAGRKIFGMPWVLGRGAWGVSDEHIDRECELGLLEGTDIVLSHNPPIGVLDQSSIHLGSFGLRKWIDRRKPKLSVFGHCHEARGHKRVGSTYFVNATLGTGCGSNGLPVRPKYEPWGLADNSWDVTTEIVVEQKTVLLQLATGTHQQLLDAVADWHLAYTVRHGMRYVQLRESPLPHLPASWGKIRAILDQFETGAQTVVWLDTDAVVVNAKENIAEACRRGIGAVWYDKPFPHYQAGVLICHRSDAVISCLRSVLAAGEKNAHDLPGRFGQWEQTPLNELGVQFRVLEPIDAKWNCVPQFISSPAPAVLASHGAPFEERLNLIRRFSGTGDLGVTARLSQRRFSATSDWAKEADRDQADRIESTAGLLELLKFCFGDTRIKLSLEIGSHRGVSTEAILQFSDAVFSVDPSRPPEFAHLQSIYGARLIPINFTSEECLAYLPKACFDFVYIDGQHGYKEVLADIHWCLPLLRAGGWIAGHDYNTIVPNCGVIQAVDEVFGKNKNVSVFSDTSWACRV